MKIELTMTELLLIIDMIKNGTEQDNEGADTYTVKDFYDAFIKSRRNEDANARNV
jgi:hypothetical protein